MFIACDVMDALTTGKMYDSGYLGHGSIYYSTDENIRTEIFANISDLYNNGKLSVLDGYLPSDIKMRFVSSYESNFFGDSFIKMDALTRVCDNKNIPLESFAFDYLKTGDYSLIPKEVRDYMTYSFGGVDYDAYSNYFKSYTGATAGLEMCEEIINGNNGAGVFRKQLEQYISTGNIEILPETGGIREFISSTSDDIIQSYINSK